MKKNLTPLQLTFVASLIISTFVIGIFSIVNAFTHFLEWLLIPLLLMIIYIVCFITIYYVLEIFIYRKIKLIYKSIHSLKAGFDQKNRKVDLNKDVISEINAQVSEWAASHIKEMDEMKKAEIYRREFLSNVSHELKSPIFNIQGYLHTLIDNELQDSTINMKYLRKAANNLENLSNIVNDLEIISRFESGELPLVKTRFDITALIKEVMDSMEYAAQLHEINMSIKEGCHRSHIVIADRERIKQVLNNLISNSIKYGREKGKTLIGIYDMADNILVEVSDNGIGIEQEHLPRLFERFYRVDKSRSRKDGGSGLGLSIVKHTIEAHGQTIHVRSTPNVGSTFGFTLKKA